MPRPMQILLKRHVLAGLRAGGLLALIPVFTLGGAPGGPPSPPKAVPDSVVDVYRIPVGVTLVWAHTGRAYRPGMGFRRV